MTNTTPGAMRRHCSTLLLAVVTAASLAACGGTVGGGSGSGADAGASGGGATQLAKTRLDSMYKGFYGKPQSDTPKPPTGKNVWVLAYDLSQGFSERAAKASVDAGKTLNWNVHVFDAKGDPNTALQGIRGAIAAKADGLIVQIYDCSSVQSGLEQARAAGIKIVSDEGSDCAKPLFNANTPFTAGGYPGNDGTYKPWVTAWAKPNADWIAVKSKGSAKVIVVAETDASSTIIAVKGFREELAAACPGCKVVATVNIVGADVGTPLQQKIQQALLQHPDATAVANTIADYAQTGGIAAAVQASGRAGKLLLTGGEGAAPNMDLIRQNQGQDTATCQDLAWNAYADMDQLIRLFTGAPAATDSGMGFNIVDRQHNLPPKGSQCVPTQDGKPVDYAGMYKQIWTR